MTKLFAVGAVGVIGAGAFVAVRAKRRADARRQQANALDPFAITDLDEPVIISEEVVFVTEDPPSEMPGRGAAPR